MKLEQICEGGMPQSIIRAKQRIGNMTEDERKEYFKGRSKERLEGMARMHGYGQKSGKYEKYWDGVS